MDLIEKDPLQKRLESTNWIILVALVGSSLFLNTNRFSLGILCGGLISIVNFHWLYRNLMNVFTKHPDRAKKAILIHYYIRLAVIAFLLFWVISGNLVDIIGLVIGLSVVPLNMVLTTIRVLSKKNCIEGVR
ncbi:MAG: ATP synthase subunit I [Syntrophales bacterium]|nr:ATP synthase subunit I [Syntrophales bacterium]